MTITHYSPTDPDSHNRELAAIDAAIAHNYEVLDILVHDSDPMVRVMVAKMGRDQDREILANDQDSLVREAVRRYGKKLN